MVLNFELFEKRGDNTNLLLSCLIYFLRFLHPSIKKFKQSIWLGTVLWLLCNSDESFAPLLYIRGLVSFVQFNVFCVLVELHLTIFL